MKHPENFPKLSRKYPENFLKIPEIYMLTLVFISWKFPCLIGCGLAIALQVTEISWEFFCSVERVNFYQGSYAY
jgi:hypothetical protein